MSFKNRGSLKKIRTNIFKSSNYNCERYRRNDQLEKIVDPINLKKRKKKIYLILPLFFLAFNVHLSSWQLQNPTIHSNHNIEPLFEITLQLMPV